MTNRYAHYGENKITVHKKSPLLADLLVFTFLIFILYSLIILATQWHSPVNPKFTIDLSIIKLPYYAILSTGRMTIAYILSLIFSLVYARIAVVNRKAEGIMIPILDVLQSIPILSFMPGVVLGLVAIFPHSNIGLELAAVILIFTSQAWNITFGFYQTLLTIPQELKEVALINRLTFWQRFIRLEIPSGIISLIWNSMMSWSGGWFFLMASEQFTLGNRSFQLPGLGSFLQAAANKGNITALFLGITTLIFIIIFLDQFLWRPLIAWGDRFKIEQDESNEKPQSWFLTLLAQSNIFEIIHNKLFVPVFSFIAPLSRMVKTGNRAVEKTRTKIHNVSLVELFTVIIIILLILLFAFGIFASFSIISQISISEWRMIAQGAFATILRTTSALLISMIWTVPVGVAIGLSPTWSKRAQPLVQMAASIPATALFPALLLILLVLPSGLNIAAVILMLLGTQWYVLFNVIAGAMSIPNDLQEASTIYQIKGLNRWRFLILPSIFPYLVTGMITATGGAWNASIVAEYVTFGGSVHKTIGLGALIAGSANTNNYHLLFASTITMAILVFCINKFFWQRLYHFAENKYHFE